MEDDDSQDELINRSASHSKGKRPVLWPISDDSDDVQEESEEGESDSAEEDEEEEEEDHLDGEDDEEEDAAAEEEDLKQMNRAFGETSAELAGMSSDEDSDKCPICLNSFSSQPVATPESCEHYFCLDCILEWTKNANSCPVDRNAFNNIYLRKCYGGKVKKIITVQKPVKEGQEETVDVDLEQTNCEVCGGSDREDRLLLCDGCDAGYHMECLTPPLDSVPVEEWFCPHCEVNNRPLRGSAEEHSAAESLPSTARSAISRYQPRTAGPTRAIARTQQSERVRANVNRHRITQARTSQLAPTYLIQSSWLDETINAVVAGLNTSVYIRDFTPRVPSTHRRKTRKRRQIKSKKTSSTKGKPGKASSTGVRKRKRRVRRTKSRKKQVLKMTATPKSRIANNLGIVKDKRSSSLPTVYRPSEQTLSSMRADIGAACLSIYGDPFDLDPFVDREEEAHVTSLLEAKRRGISRSALRSHQPVAHPIHANLSRRGIEVSQSRGVVEAAPVPDLLGSILSGQSVLLMDSSDVVINRDGSLKAMKPMLSSTPSCSKTSISEDASNPALMPSLVDSSSSDHYNGDLPGFSHCTTDRLLPQNSELLPSFTTSANHTNPHPYSASSSRGHPGLLLPRPNRPMPFPEHRGTDDVKTHREISSSSIQSLPEASSSKNKGVALSQPQPKKAPTKPMWIDVSVLPRIPKIKKECFTNDDASQDSSNTVNGSRGSTHSTTGSNIYGIPVTGMISLAGDKSVDHQKGTAGGHSQRRQSDRAGQSSAFSSSFSSSSSSSYPASQPRYSSSSSAVSFRINSSGNSWHSRRLSTPSISASGGSNQEHCRENEDEAKKRRLHKDKQMLLASCTMVNREQDSNIYDPFNPTLSDSSSSDTEDEKSSLNRGSQHATHKERAGLGTKDKDGSVQNKLINLVQVKTETQEMEVSQEEAKRGSSVKNMSQEECVHTKKESKLVDTKAEKKKDLIKIKKEPGFDDAGDGEKSSQYANPSPSFFKAEKDTLEKESGQSVPHNRDLGLKKKTSKTTKEQCSSSSGPDGGSRQDHQASSQRDKQKEKDKKKGSKQLSSRERRRSRSTSESSQSSPIDRSRRKRRQSRSQSKDRKRSRSVSSCSSGERSKKKHEQWHKEKNVVRQTVHGRGRVSKDRRHGRSCSSQSRSRSRSRSRSLSQRRKPRQSKSRSRSREKRKDHGRLKQPPHSSRDKVESLSKEKRKHRSRSSSRERRKEGSSKRSQKTTESCSLSSKDTKKLQDCKKEDNICSPLKEVRVKKQLSSCTSTSKGDKENNNLRASKEVTKSEITDMGVVKELKKERQPALDMFEDFPVIKPPKKETLDISSVTTSKGTNEKEIKEETFRVGICKIKSETFEIPSVKSESGSPEMCHLPTVNCFSTLTTPVTVTSTPQDVFYQSGLTISEEKTGTAVLPATVKLEVQQPSDCDDDLSIDVMLDSLEYVKSEHTEENVASIKHEKGEDGTIEGDQVSAVVGAKTKTQVKRVTWNIQEPEGPQPEKSASKLALYKLKLKQEGARRPSSTVQSSGQDVTRAVTDPSTSSRVDVQHQVHLSATGQGEAEEGDFLKKDKQFLKKLHMQERAIEEVKLAIKPFYQRRDINKDEYKDILRKAVHKVCHSKSGEINPVKVGNLVKAYVDKYKHARKHKKGEDITKAPDGQTEPMKTTDSP